MLMTEFKRKFAWICPKIIMVLCLMLCQTRRQRQQVKIVCARSLRLNQTPKYLPMSSLPILELRWKVVFTMSRKVVFTRLPRGTLMGILFTGIVPEPFQGVYENIAVISFDAKGNTMFLTYQRIFRFSPFSNLIMLRERLSCFNRLIRVQSISFKLRRKVWMGG